jgi:hypothetical protein
VDELINILIERLVNKGLEITSIPAYVRDLANTIAVNGNWGPSELNRRLQTLGWDDFEIDEYTLDLVAAILGQNIQYKPPSWFVRTFNSKGVDDLIDGEPLMLGRQGGTNNTSGGKYGTKR